MKQARKIVACMVLCLLSACGGGGGGSGGTDDPMPITVLSGSIAVTETAWVDSDLNDEFQTGYSRNDSPGTAQPITSPLLLVGTVNQASTGPRGSNFAGGDADDFFGVTLSAGQVVELEFATDPTESDIDLYVGSVDGTQVGISESEDSRFECVTIATSGTYYINVFAFRRASIYNLRIGAPGSAGSCAQQTTPASFDPSELLAQGKPALATRAATLQRTAGVTTLGVAGGPQLLRLPATASQRAQHLSALRASASGTAPSKALPSNDEALPPVLEALRYAKALRASGAYDYVHPNWIMRRQALTGSFPPDDRNYPYQRWHYEQIRLPEAMARIDGLSTQPSVRPIVAVIDDGVMRDHTDFSGQLTAGCKFVSSETPRASCGASGGDNVEAAGNQPVFHGTHVAGTIAAATAFPGETDVPPVGGAGVAPMALVMPLRVFSPVSGGASSYDIVQAMRYAARLSNDSGTLPARRADVINMSLGSDRSCDSANDGAYRTVIRDVRAAGVVVVISSGNSGRNDRNQPVAVGSPANCPGAIAVGATDARKRVTYYSNTGSALTVAAPGGDSGQSTTGNGSPDSIYSDIGSFDSSGTRQPSFGGMMGTSMAAPHVSGVVALMRYINPALSPAQVDALFANGDLTDDLGTVGRDDDFGWGLINARKAVDAALASLGGVLPPEPPVQVVASPAALDFGSFQTQASFDLQAAGTTAETVATVTSNHAAVTVSPLVGTNGGLGRYTVSINRSLLGAPGSYFPRITIVLSPSRTLVVQLSVIQPSSGSSGARVGDYGPIYVLLVDPATQEVLDTVLATRNASGYVWSYSGFTGTRLSIVAGGDLDNDGFICQSGEPCGGYPVLSPASNQAAIDISGSRSDLNFQVAPLSGISTQSVGRVVSGFQRTPLTEGAR